MKRERLNHLLDMVDELNEKAYVSASLQHGKYSDDIHITIFYTGKDASMRTFTTYDIGYQAYNNTFNDKDLIKAEAFLRMLLAATQHCEAMRRPEE